MGDYKSAIRAYQTNIEKERQEIGSLYKKIGNYLFENKPELSGNPVQETNFSSGNEITSAIDGVDNRIEEIISITEHQTELRNRIKTNTASIKALKTQNREHYEQIGEAAYEAYKRNPFVDKRYKDLFLELEQNHQELKEMENDIDRSEQNLSEKPFFNKVVERGKIFLLRNKRTSKINAIPRFYKHIGEQICESDFLETTENELIKQTAQPCIERRQTIQDLETQNDKLANDITKMDEELSELCRGNRTDRELAVLKKERQDKENQLEGVYESIGIAFVAEPDKTIASDPDINNPLDQIRQLEEDIRKEEEQVTKLSAAVKAEELQASIKKTEITIESKEKQIETLKEEVGSLKTELEETEKELKRFESIRGPEEDLNR
jgi:chromosome segregation ATPase